MSPEQALVRLQKDRAMLRRRLGLSKPGELERGDEADIIAAELERETLFTNRERWLAELGRIDDALDRLHAGEWGICTTCEGSIALARLAANPAAARCVRCEEAREQQESKLGPAPPLRIQRVIDDEVPPPPEPEGRAPVDVEPSVPPISELEETC